ncbi:MAG TPA: hypothetical protein VGO59_16410 [Verrucomicrobiae bacterium]|jgi:hypothetical protein
MRRSFLALLLAWLAAGCAAPLPTRTVASPLPADGLLTERAVLTARGKQFALNGYLSQSAAGGRRLIITEMFGQTLADVLIKPDGTVQVLRSSRVLRPAWIKRFIAADVQCIFGGSPGPVRKLSETHFEIRRLWYKLDVQIVETRPGPQPKELFDTPAKP